MVQVSLIVNGSVETHDIEPQTLLVEFLRETCRLTGTNIGCDTTQCGCCTVHMDNHAVKACTILAVQADGKEIVTIEGIGNPKALHPMQEAFREHHALQCGYCTSGMIMQAIDIVRQNKASDETEIRHELEGNFCRCTGYQNIVDAIRDVAENSPQSCQKQDGSQ